MPPTRKTAQSVYEKLATHYGRPAATHPSGHPMNVLVETILSQHTSDKNSHRAFVQLRKVFPTWQQVIDAPTPAVEDAIRSGGLAKQKSARIQAVLREIRDREGRLSLARLRRLPTAEAYDYLISLPGIGGKTACCVLLFSLGRAVMPVDTHIHRIIRRLGWISDKAPPEAARGVVEARLPAESLYHMHVLLIAHGRETCKAQRPLCAVCPIRRHCPSARLGGR